MNYLSAHSYHRSSLGLLKSNLIPNVGKLLLIEFILFISTFSILLVPLIPIVHSSLVIQLIENGHIDFKTTLKAVDMDSSKYINLLLLISLVSVILLAGFSLLFIPGVIFALSLSAVPYLLARRKNYSFSTILGQSMDIMKGNKTKLLLIILWGIIYGLFALLGVGLVAGLLEGLAFVFYNIEFVYYIIVGIEFVILVMAFLILPLLLKLELSLAITLFIHEKVGLSYFSNEI